MTGALHELVEAQVARTPDAVALEFESATTTYSELDRQASRLARSLRERGIGPGALVGVACERSPAMMIALLGILKSGGAYVPLDLESPPARLGDVLRQCGRPLVVTTAAGADVLPVEHTGGLLRVDRLADDSRPLDSPVPVRPDDLIYVIFTSGSSGRPKGVMTEHAPVVNRLRWMIDNHPLSVDDKVIHKTPIYFDVSVWEMFWPLCFGATLVIARPGGHRDADYLVRTVRTSRITAAHFVPSMLYAFLEHPMVSSCRTLKRVYCSGEALSPALQEKFFGRLDATLTNLYGPTEAAIEVSHWTCVPGTPTVPIGYPIDNTRLYVLDDRQRPVPDGQPGELVIAGLPVARGYLGRPELTAQVFLDDPYGPPGERMYRTGDRALRRPDGAFEYLGRLDDQVKLRGQRIELGEVEACLQSHPAVGRAVVALKSRGEADQRLVGYLLPTPGQDSDRVTAAVRAHARERLPDYMVPAAFVVVDRIPLSPSGKVDRRALPDPAPAGREHRQPPRPGIEAEVAERWTQVLGCGAPDRRDRFLDSGGNSLLATVLAARLSHELGRPVTVARIIGAGSLAELAAAMDSTPVAGAETFAFPAARSLDEQRLDRVATMSADELDALLEDLEGVG
ncbi:amino acid adenylation domain-containing protein [Solwaraspora sp. WMMD1047]|uniref:amino acid adenylation domain-containing protein n=1 Tax=Solwaraspora sp. WMMD1047 TaxID=3016102 RepID=UPI0024177241|nr:amino acid adenylation domain-containing protein [Solwaraspora sp. WMMD1047]MDG4834269.1 amino acid adenylation domain-containing protein [Solwaraspora sp. WMMD1047]